MSVLLLGLGGGEADLDGRLLGLEAPLGRLVEVGVGELAVDLGELGLVGGDLALARLRVLVACLEHLPLDDGPSEDPSVAETGEDDATEDHESEDPHPPHAELSAFRTHVVHALSFTQPGCVLGLQDEAL